MLVSFVYKRKILLRIASPKCCIEEYIQREKKAKEQETSLYRGNLKLQQSKPRWKTNHLYAKLCRKAKVQRASWIWFLPNIIGDRLVKSEHCSGCMPIKYYLRLIFPNFFINWHFVYWACELFYFLLPISFWVYSRQIKWIALFLSWLLEKQPCHLSGLSS